MCAIPLRAQTVPAFQKLFDDYSQKKDCQTVMMGQAIFEMMEQKAKDSGKDVSGYSVLKGIDVIYIMKVPTTYSEFEPKLNNLITSNLALELVGSTSNDEVSQKAYLAKKSGKNNLFAQVRVADGATTVIFIHGDFTLKSISNIPSILK